jgi:hypothetical protein
MKNAKLVRRDGIQNPEARIQEAKGGDDSGY